ncbi:unnamed protein product [Hydatigera taeniaeformis]|uniref:PC4 domain-containing protein n=1 Tax=Hydatigena taeniaeformis TaxID=6205 RepID=A0A0R3X1R1_HYDTA|nr:unnamed protein product [Hydatigera taeniaeformis]
MSPVRAPPFQFRVLRDWKGLTTQRYSRKFLSGVYFHLYGTLYDKNGSAENVRITVPLDNDDGTFTPKDMLKALPIFQQRINDVLTAKIGDGCVEELSNDQDEDQE